MARRAQEDHKGTAYTLPELAQVSAIDYRTLHNWHKRGLLHASRQVANGSGTVALFDEGDARQVLILAALRRGGMEMRVLEVIAEPIWQLTREPIEAPLLVVTDGYVALASDSELRDRLSGEQPSHVLPVQSVLRALDQMADAA